MQSQLGRASRQPRPQPNLSAHSIGRSVRGLTSPKAVLTGPALLAIAALLGFPVIYVGWLSLHRWAGSRTIPWDFVGIANYTTALFQDRDFQRALVVTVEFTVATVTLSLIVGIAFALILNRRFRGYLLVIALLLIPVVSTPVAVASTWKRMLQFEGLINEITSAIGLGAHSWLSSDLVLPTLVFEDVTRTASLVTLIVLAGLTALPTEPFEAARMDGASDLQTIRYITLPLLRPFIAVAALLRTIDAVKAFDDIQVITRGGPAGSSQTVYLYAYKQSFEFLNLGYVAAIIVVIVALVLALSLIVIRIGGAGQA